jgi:hypothetical protein
MPGLRGNAIRNRALGGSLNASKYLPVANGKPVFTPGAIETFAVAMAFAFFAAIAFALGFKALFSEYRPYVNSAGFLIGGVLVIRAIGELIYRIFQACTEQRFRKI